MYNRYVPQPDGSYRRNFVQDPAPPPKPRPPHPSGRPSCPPPQPVCPPEKPANPPHKPLPPRQKPTQPTDINIGTFLKQLLPRELDTGDLLVIILLLLMGGDCPEDRNHALLTLFLYLFL